MSLLRLRSAKAAAAASAWAEKEEAEEDADVVFPPPQPEPPLLLQLEPPQPELLIKEEGEETVEAPVPAAGELLELTGEDKTESLEGAAALIVLTRSPPAPPAAFAAADAEAALSADCAACAAAYSICSFSAERREKRLPSLRASASRPAGTSSLPVFTAPALSTPAAPWPPCTPLAPPSAAASPLRRTGRTLEWM